jgi:hypothetical protein
MTSRSEWSESGGFKVSWIVNGVEFPLREIPAGEFVGRVDKVLAAIEV